MNRHDVQPHREQKAAPWAMRAFSISIGILALFSLLVNNLIWPNTGRGLFCLCFNTMLLLVMYFLPVNWLVTNAWLFYLYYLALLLIGLFGGKIAGEYIYINDYLYINMNSMIAMLFLPVTYLIVKYKNYSWKYLLTIGAILFVPIALFITLTDAFDGFLLFFVVVLLLLLKASREKRLKIGTLKLLVAVLMALFSAIFLYLLSDLQAMQRIVDTLNSVPVDGAGAAAQFHLAQTIIRDAPLIAEHTFAAADLQVLAEGDGWEFVLLLGHFGWLAGIVLIVGQIVLTVSAYRMSAQIKNSYAKYLTFAIASYFGFKSLIAILQQLGVIPFSGIQMPLLGAGSVAVTEFVLLGLFLSLYIKREKITVKMALDVDYDSTADILHMFCRELEREYARTEPKNEKRRQELQTSIREIKRDETAWTRREISQIDVVRKYGQYRQLAKLENQSVRDTIFISYNSNDRPYAEYLCHAIEAQGVKCWYYERDCPSGEYAEKIMKMLRRTKIFVVIISRNSNFSKHVLNEVCIAFEESDNGTVLMPLKIEDIKLSDNMHYYLCRQEWNTAKNSRSMKAFADCVVKIFNAS